MNNAAAIALRMPTLAGVRPGWFSRLRHILLKRRQMRSLAAAIARGAIA